MRELRRTNIRGRLFPPRMFSLSRCNLFHSFFYFARHFFLPALSPPTNSRVSEVRPCQNRIQTRHSAHSVINFFALSLRCIHLCLCEIVTNVVHIVLICFLFFRTWARGSEVGTRLGLLMKTFRSEPSRLFFEPAFRRRRRPLQGVSGNQLCAKNINRSVRLFLWMRSSTSVSVF